MLARYTELFELGQGDYGQVFLAYDRQEQRHVAIKKAHIGMEDTLTHERLILSRLQPIAGVPHLLDCISLAADGEAEECLVLEYIVGQCVSDCASRSLPLQRVINSITQLFTILVQLHIIGIVHNDLRNENILHNDEGIFVVDFGRAQIVDSGSSVEFRRDVYDMLVIAESWLCSLPRQCSRQTRRTLLTWLAEQQETHHDMVLSASSMLTNWQRLTMQLLQTPAPVSSLSA